MPDINITTLKTILAGMGYNEIKPLSLTAFGVLLPKTKVDKFIPMLAKELEAYRPEVVNDRELRIGDLTVFAKNRDLQRGVHSLTYGRHNEQNFMLSVNEYMRDWGKPLNVEFVVHDRVRFRANGVTKITHTCAKNVFQRLKADVHLITERGQHYPISIKDDAASYWESADSYWGAQSRTLLNYALKKNLTQLDQLDATTYTLRPPIAVQANEKETRDVVFGNDIFGKGAVVSKTFKPNSFEWDYNKDVLVISCSSVITTTSDVDNAHAVWFEIRNDKSRQPKHLMKGLRAMAIMRYAITSKEKMLSPGDRTKAGL